MDLKTLPKLKYYFINGGPLQNSNSDSLTRLLNGVAQDLVLIASKSTLIDNKIFEDNNFIKRDMRLGITSLEAAIDFDNYSRNRSLEHDEAIFIMRKKIIHLERQLLLFKRCYGMSLIHISKKIFRKIKRLLFDLALKLNGLLKSIFRSFSKNNCNILVIKRIYKVKYIFFILRILEKLIDKIGFRLYLYKFVRKSKKIKEDLELVSHNDNKLKAYYHSSLDAKNIFKDLQKYSKS